MTQDKNRCEDECFLTLQLRRISTWEVWERIDSLEHSVHNLEQTLQQFWQQLAPVVLVMNGATMLNPSPHGY